MLGDTGNKRAVRILLECILVCYNVMNLGQQLYREYLRNKCTYFDGASYLYILCFVLWVVIFLCK